MDDPRHALGLHGEQVAERHLRRAGMKFVARRFDTPAGELDLVMLEGRTVVFVEVKTQTTNEVIEPEERVRFAKQRKLTAAAKWFLAKRRWEDRPCRFDVVAVTRPADGEPSVRHIPEAFIPERW